MLICQSDAHMSGSKTYKLSDLSKFLHSGFVTGQKKATSSLLLFFCQSQTINSDVI